MSQRGIQPSASKPRQQSERRFGDRKSVRFPVGVRRIGLNVKIERAVIIHREFVVVAKRLTLDGTGDEVAVGAASGR